MMTKDWYREWLWIAWATWFVSFILIVDNTEEVHGSRIYCGGDQTSIVHWRGQSDLTANAAKLRIGRNWTWCPPPLLLGFCFSSCPCFSTMPHMVSEYLITPPYWGDGCSLWLWDGFSFLFSKPRLPGWSLCSLSGMDVRRVGQVKDPVFTVIIS